MASSSSAATPFDPFAALGLPRDASTPAITARYRELARKYHPNRRQGSEESKAVLSEQFHNVHQAWTYLVEPDKRRRYLELLRLTEEQDTLLAQMADLLTGNEHTAQMAVKHAALQDGNASTDADEDDLPYVGPSRRRETLQRAATGVKHLESLPDGSEGATTPDPRQTRSRSPGMPPQTGTESTAKTEAADGDYFTLRRKKLEKLRRKEISAFDRYRNAMIEKFEAEMEAERQRDLYERVKWKREYFERAPRETAERLRSFQHFMSAFRAFGRQAPRRRNQSTITYSGQILSTEDLFESGQYLAPDGVTSPTRSKALHRRGWSSDISGDQTSSDDNSSGRASPRPGLGWTWQRRHSRNTSLDAFQPPSIVRPDVHSGLPVRDHAPFKMLVKRPTGFPELGDEQDSSPESALASTRSPSPQPCNQFVNAFTISQTRRLSDILQRPRPGGRPSDTEGGDAQGATAPVRMRADSVSQIGHFVIKHVGRPQFDRVPMDHVYELSYTQKCAILDVERGAQIDPIGLLERLFRLDQNVADKFMVKPDTKERFNFRLIYGRPEAAGAQSHTSYIALSYRRKLHVEKKADYFTLPLDREMFQAVWDERQSDTEGVWIDQICIDQDSREETTVSMSAMDMVYRSARLIVVALDDIVLDANEGAMLESHMDEYARMLHVAATKRFRGKQPAYLDTREELFDVLGKLLRSSWFRRAWCRHEMRLARDHIFLVPCKSPGTRTGRNVVRFTGHCLTHLLALAAEVPFEPGIEMVKPALHAFFRDRNRLAPQDKHLHSHHGNFTTVVAEVFGMEAGGDPRIPAKQRAADAMKDKISIILNTMECGLALTPSMRDPSMPLTKSECHYMLLVLALAAQDPGALCSVGPPMRLVQRDSLSPLSPTASSTWLFEPTNVDSGLNNYRTLNRIPASSRIHTGLQAGEHYVQLDLKFLQAGNVRRALEDPANLDLARHFTEVCTRRKYGRNRRRYLTHDLAANRHFGSMPDVYLQTLACVLDCGPDWVEDVCHRYGVSRWKQDGPSAWNLLVALKNTDGRWPEEAWSPQAAGFLMDFVNFLIIRGMPQRQIIHREEWRPIWLLTETGGKILTFVPPGEICPAVPTALLDTDYIHLARLWVLEPRPSFVGALGRAAEEVGGSAAAATWTLSGKSVLFSDDLALQGLHSASAGVWREQQRVFGREDPEIQRLLRERSLHF